MKILLSLAISSTVLSFSSYGEIKITSYADHIMTNSVQMETFGRTVKPMRMTIAGANIDIGFIADDLFNYLRDEDDFESEYRVRFKDGSIYQDGEVLSTVDGNEFIFIVDNDGKMYGTYADPADGVFHSSLIGDEWPISAGTLETDAQGRLTKITDYSGHFKPNDIQFEVSVDLLKYHNVDVPKESMKQIFDSGTDHERLLYRNSREFRERVKLGEFCIN